MKSFQELFAQLLAMDETSAIEAKRSEEISQSAAKTICAFANEPGLGGGHLMLGVSRSEGPGDYEVTGVPNPDKLQNDLANMCAGSFNVVIRPEMTVCLTENGHRVVLVRVPESDPSDKPVYFKKQGLPKGAYRRIGSADHSCTDDDLAALYQLRESEPHDKGVIDGATLSDIDRSAVREYRRARAELSATAEELKLSMPDLLVSLGCLVQSNSRLSITRAGLLLFGKAAAIRRLCPWARIDYLIVPGEEWVPDQAQRYRSVEILEPLLLALPRIVELVAQDLPKAIQLKRGKIRRKEIPAIPFTVIREAIVNAVMHRSYRAYQPIQIIKFSNRLEIRNAGYSLVAEDRLDEPGSKTRNPNLASVLRDTGFAETKGTGIRVMRQQMNEANLTAPLFRSNREGDSFEVTLLTHHLLDADTVKWLSGLSKFTLTDHEAKALVIARQTGYVDNSRYRAANDVDVLTASMALRRLRSEGLLKRHGKSTATFYTLAPAAGRIETTTNLPDMGALSRGLPAEGQTSASLSPEVLKLLKRVGSRSAKPELVEVAILRLCAARPMSLTEIGQYVGRDPQYLGNRFVGKLVKEGALRYLFPSKPAHPRQAYMTAPLLADIPIPADTRRKKGKKDRAPRLPGL